MRLVLPCVFATVLAGCGADGGESPATKAELDAVQLVAQLSDLPPGWSIVPAESFPVSTSDVLRVPRAARAAPTIRSERLSGYQVSFVNPRAAHVQCSAAV